jgi:16S rRNA C967 or C1407 C5-methylase (RsmB/RsmF family)
VPLDRYRSIVPDWSRFQDVVQTPEPTFLRVRTGRVDAVDLVARLEARGYRLATVGIPEDVFRVDVQPGPVANTLEHWLGLFYVQQRVTALAAPTLAPLPGERVLDMAAAPGGKTTHLADLMADRGSLVACDRSEKRLRGLLGNLYRTAHPNVLVLAADGRGLGGEALFDRVLLDAPCSGEGTLRKRGGETKEPDAGYLEHIIGVQRGLLRRAADLLRPGGTLLYVTCTFNPDENEAVVSRILEERGGDLEVEPIPLDAPHAPGVTSFEGRSFHPGLEAAWRIYPHHLDSGGLFMCRLRRKGEADRGRVDEDWRPVPDVFPGEDVGPADRSEARADAREGERQLREVYGVPPEVLQPIRWLARGDSVWGTTSDAWAPTLWDEGTRVRVISFGLRCLKHDPRAGLRPTNDFFQWLGDRLGRRVIEPDRDQWRTLLARQPLEAEGQGDGFVVLRLDGRTVGRGLVWKGNLRHEIPKAQAARLRDVLEA